MVAETPLDTAITGTVSIAEPSTVALSRNVTDPAVTAESTVALSPAFANTATVEPYQSPATPFFDHLPVVSQLSPDAPSFHTYSPARVSETTTFVPPSARLSA